MEFSFAVCDDDRNHLDALQNMIGQMSGRYRAQVSTYLSSGEFLDSLTNAKMNGEKLPDFALIDIELPEMDGIELGKRVKALCPDICLVFVTSHAEYAIKGYEAKADGYLLKPVTESDIESLMEMYLKHNDVCKKIIVKDKEREHLISIKDIVYISAEDKYTILYTEHNRFLDYKSLKDYEELLSEYGFFRIHRKYLINMRYHKSLGKGYVTIAPDIELPISRRKECLYREKLFQLLEKDLL